MKGLLSYVVILPNGRTIGRYVEHLRCRTSSTSDDQSGVEVPPADEVTVPETQIPISLKHMKLITIDTCLSFYLYIV